MPAPRSITIPLDGVDHSPARAEWVWQSNPVTITGALEIDLIDGADSVWAEIHGSAAPDGGDPLASVEGVEEAASAYVFDLTTEAMGVATAGKSRICYLSITCRNAGGGTLQTLYLGRLEIKAIPYSGADPTPPAVVLYALAGDLEDEIEDREAADTALHARLTAVEAPVEWGDIEGTLADQTDLQAALDTKADASALADYQPAFPGPQWAACTFSAADNTVTCAGHGLSNNSPVRFAAGNYPTSTGGVLGATAVVPNRVYYVKEVAGDTFKIADYLTGTAIDITSAGASVLADIGVREDFYLPVGQNGGIQIQATDSTAAGGNTRGGNARDFQAHRTAATKVAAAFGSVIMTGYDNLVSSGGGADSTFFGAFSGIFTGYGNTLTGNGRGSAIFGNSNSSSGSGSTVMFIAGVSNVIFPGSGGTSTCLGDQHIGGGQNVTWVGGFHSLINTVGTTDFGASGAQIGAQGAGTIINYAGGFNMIVMGAGAVAGVQGERAFVSHGNKNKGFFDITIQYSSTTAGSGTVAAGATVTVEKLPMGYHSGANLKKLAVWPNRLYTLELQAVITLVHASTPLLGVIRKRANYFTGLTANAVPSLIGSVTTIETAGNNGGALPDPAWDLVITPEAGVLTFDLTVKNTAAEARNIHALTYVAATWVATNIDT